MITFYFKKLWFNKKWQSYRSDKKKHFLSKYNFDPKYKKFVSLSEEPLEKYDGKSMKQLYIGNFCIKKNLKKKCC